MIAIGVIVILAGILILGLSKVKNTAQAQSTKVTLESLRGMLGEFETATRFRAKTPDGWVWEDGAIIREANPQLGNLWLTPAGTSGLKPDLDAPGDVRAETTAESKNSRHGSRAVVNTTVAMGEIARVGANRTALSGTSQDSFFYPEWVDPQWDVNLGQRFPGPGTDNVQMTNNELNEAVIYLKGMRVKHKAKNYICTESEPGTTPPDASSQWREDTAATPMLKDGWGNPIIFVPATGLRVRMLLDASNLLDSAVQSDQKYTRVVTSAGLVDPNDPTLNYNTANYRAPAGVKPFFASAGPDGNFATGDDNVYSFEN
jgi:type II secretory pathway pseudopilin PulG